MGEPRHYRVKRDAINRDYIAALVDALPPDGGRWTFDELHVLLAASAKRRKLLWHVPAGHALSALLRNYNHELKTAGWTVTFPRTKSARLIELVRAS